MNFKWYINRLKAMSVPELGYRANQFLQKKGEQYLGVKLDQNIDFEFIYHDAVQQAFFDIPQEELSHFRTYTHFTFFGTTLDLTKQINWHKDILNNSIFPLAFTKNIKATSAEYGLAKAVLEVNRMQFLIPLALKCRESNRREDLDLIIDILQSWILENPYLKGVNWFSNIEVNIRIIVWYYVWQILCSHEHTKASYKFKEFAVNMWLPSIHQHCVHSYRNHSKFSSANNHLISELSGLFIGAGCWKFPESEKWIDESKAGLEREIMLQHSHNGINKEESSEYIQFITDFLLLPYIIGERANRPFSIEYKNKLQDIFKYIYTLLDIKGNFVKYGDEDDGKVLWCGTGAHFNNFKSLLVSGVVVSGEADLKTKSGQWDLKNWLLWGNKGKQIFDQAYQTDSVTERSTFYKDEGHFFFRKCNHGEEILLHLDAAPLGYLSIAAHGHSDALSVILHVDGKPVLVDPGTYIYHSQIEWRRYFVSTLGHNTISIDGQNQAYLAGPMMWLKHYTPSITEVKKEDVEFVIAKHNGFKRLGVKHTRKTIFNRDKDQFIIEDYIETERTVTIYQPWHLHPDVIVECKGNTSTLFIENEQRSVTLSTDKKLSVERVKGKTDPIIGWYSASFLQKEPSVCLLASAVIEKGIYTFTTVININSSI